MHHYCWCLTTRTQTTRRQARGKEEGEGRRRRGEREVRARSARAAGRSSQSSPAPPGHPGHPATQQPTARQACKRARREGKPNHQAGGVAHGPGRGRVALAAAHRLGLATSDMRAPRATVHHDSRRVGLGCCLGRPMLRRVLVSDDWSSGLKRRQGGLMVV